MAYSPELDEAWLEHFDNNMDHVGYRETLERMRANGHEPKGEGAPLPESQYHITKTGRFSCQK